MSLPIHSWKISSKDYEGRKEHVCTKPFESKIHTIQILIFNKKENQRLEVHVTTWNVPTYLKIIEIAQNNFSDQKKYHFDSGYHHFPKDKNNQCTYARVKEYYDLSGQDLFKKTHLEHPLGYFSYYKNQEELDQQLRNSLEVLQKVDSTIEEIVRYLNIAILK
jgi:hypothetical protein